MNSYSTHNKFVSTPNWFESLQNQTKEDASSSVTQTMSATVPMGSSSDLSSVEIKGEGNAVTNVILENSKLTFDKELTFITEVDFKQLWELREDANGKQYIYGNLPILVKGGIVMYSGDASVEVPGLYDGIPIDADTIQWLETDAGKVLTAKAKGSAGSIMIGTKEYKPDDGGIVHIPEYPDISGKADKATTLAGYGITDAYTKKEVDTEFAKYVTIDGKQTIKGEKNFTGGLKVNGSEIVYNSEDSYWKLTGDLLVTGAISMHSSDTDYTPSTVMDGVNVDGTTIIKNASNQLCVNPNIDLGGGGGLIQFVEKLPDVPNSETLYVLI